MPTQTRTLLNRWFRPSARAAGEIKPVSSAGTAVATEIINTGEHLPVPYDENLLERARIQWQFGDWASLVKLDRDSLQHHPDRAKLALLAAAGHVQLGDVASARNFTRLAQDWGCSKKLVSQILIAGVHNSLGRAAVYSGQQQTALKNFQSAIELGAPGCDIRLITQARLGEQLAQLGLLNGRVNLQLSAENSSASATQNVPRIPSFTEILQKQNDELAKQIKKQSEDLVKLRKAMEDLVKKETQNVVKQIEAYLGIQNYFNTGELSFDMHGWPISPDLALYIIELLETKDYDLIIEFGSGTSTLLIAKTLNKIASRRRDRPNVEQVAFEHLELFHAQTLAKLQHSALEDAVKLVFAPLQPFIAPNGNTYSFYACHDTLVELAKQHSPVGLRVLVLVDGPPESTGKHARYPAVPIIFTHFCDAHIDILLDDYRRNDEKEIVQLWQAELQASGSQVNLIEKKLEKDAALIIVTPNQNLFE